MTAYVKPPQKGLGKPKSAKPNSVRIRVIKQGRALQKDNHDRLAGILETARVMIADVGIDSFNMRDLAAATGSSLQTLYTNFGNKDQLLGLVVVDTFESIIDLEIKNHKISSSGLNDLLQLLRSIHQISLAKRMYTKTSMGIYFKHDNNREFPETTYNMMYDRISICVNKINFHDKVKKNEINLLKEEMTDRVFSVVMKWSQHMLADKLLIHRLIYSTVTCLRTYVAHDQTKEIDSILAAAAKHLGRIPLI